jgi:predicted ATP-grasp superfamily ATP-dependent carboligase
MNTEKFFALILGISVNGLSVVRSLGRKGFYVIGLDRNKPAGPSASRYLREFKEVGPEIADDNLLDLIMEIGQSYSKPVFLFPTNDFFSLFVSRYAETLKRHLVFKISDQKVQEIVVNKRKLYEVAERLGISCPKTFSPRCREDIIRSHDQVRFPCFLKPAYSHLWRKKYKNVKLLEIQNQEELLARFDEVHALGLEVMIQEIVPGGDDTIYSVCAFMDREGNPLAACVKRKLRQYPIGAGDGCLQITVRNESLKDMGIRFLRGLVYVGPACIEFRWDERDNQYKLMEINVRTISAQEIIQRAGFDIPYIAYQYTIGKKIRPIMDYRDDIKWICFEWDFDSFLQARSMGILSFWDWLRSLRGVNAFAFFCWDDPMPFLVQTLQFLRRLSGKVWKMAFGGFLNSKQVNMSRREIEPASTV